MEIYMEKLNLLTGWISIFVCFLSGAVQGLFFYKENWLGGYSSWTRRMTRLGHISFFGIGVINLCYAFSVSSYDYVLYSTTVSYLFILGNISMPTVCYLSAFKKNFRHLFPIPVLSLTIALLLLIFKGLLN